MHIENIRPGDILTYWFDTGAMGAQICRATVVKVGKKKIRVKGEYGGEAWKYPEFFAGKSSTH